MKRKRRPWYQTIFYAVSWMIAGFVALGSILDSVSSAITLVTPQVTILGTVTVLGGLIGVQTFLRSHPLEWINGDGQLVRIKGLNAGLVLPFVGMLILLWIPRFTSVAPAPDSVPEVQPTPIAIASPANDWLPSDWESLESWLSEEWHSGTPPYLVESRLYSDWQLNTAIITGTVTLADMDGDARAEWALSFYDPLSSTLPMLGYAFGELLIVGDDGILYRYHGQSRYEPDCWPMLPIVKHVTDLTNDGLPDIVTEVLDCGAHTCFSSFRVLSFVTGTLENVVWNEHEYKNEIEMASANTFISDRDADGIRRLYIHGGYFGSAGAAINVEQRGRTEIWSWNPESERLTLTQTVSDPSSSPIYSLVDANELLEANNSSARARASEICNGLVEASYDGDEHERERWEFVQQFSAFRLAYIALEVNDRQAAIEWHTWLQGSFPNSIVPELTEDMISTWDQTGNLPLACALAVQSAREGDFASPYEGYAVPLLGKDDLCPITQ